MRSKIVAVVFWLFVFIYWISISLDVKWWKSHYPIIRWDVISYYGYLPAAFIFHDLKLNYVEQNPQLPVWFETAPNQNRVFKTSMGMAMLYMPFFAIGHLAAWLMGETLNGYTKPYEIAIAFAALFYLILGIFFLKKVLKKFIDKSEWIYFTILVIILGGNVMYYVGAEPGMPHVYIFALVSMFLYNSIRWHEKTNWINSLMLGLLLGMLSLVRPTNIIWSLFWLLYGITNWSTIKERINLFLKRWYLLSLVVLGIMLIWIPQLMYWKYLTGSFFYYSYGEERFFFLKPHILEALFSFRKGFFIYAPVMFFIIPGFFYLYRPKKGVFWGTTLIIVLFVYVYASWWCWWFGGSYGMRAYIDMYPLMAIPLAFSLKALFHAKNYLRLIFISIIVILTAYQIWNSFKYIHGSIHWDAMSYKVFKMNFFRLKPTDHMPVYLEYPLYEKALKYGENSTYSYAELFKAKADTVFWDMDKPPQIKHFPYKISLNDSIEFSPSSTKSFSGKLSLLLHENHLTTPPLFLDSVQKGDILFVTIKTTTARHLMLVVQAFQNPDLFYYQQLHSLKIKKNWYEVAAFCEIPVDVPRLAIYAYSPKNAEPIWVDDLMVILLKKMSTEFSP